MTSPLEKPQFTWAREGNRYALAEFFRQGGNVNDKNIKGYSLLMLAAYNDHWSTCAWLLEKGANVNSIDISGNSVLMGTCFKGHMRIIQLLLSLGADPFLQNCYGMTALDIAKAFNRPEVVRILLEDDSFLHKPQRPDRLARVIRLMSRRSKSVVGFGYSKAETAVDRTVNKSLN